MVSTLKWKREDGGATKLPVNSFLPNKLRVPSIANILKVQFSDYDTQFFQKEDGSKLVPLICIIAMRKGSSLQVSFRFIAPITAAGADTISNEMREGPGDFLSSSPEDTSLSFLPLSCCAGTDHMKRTRLSRAWCAPRPPFGSANSW